MEHAVAAETVRKRTMPRQMVDSYINNQLMGLDKGQLLLTVYDIAITGCLQEDMGKAIRALSELISALNFSHQEIAIGLFRLYQYTIDQIRAKQFQSALTILQELRETWTQAIKALN